MSRKEFQYGFSIFPVLLILVLILFGVFVYYLGNFSTVFVSSNQPVESSSNLSYLLYDTSDYPQVKDWGIRFSYQPKTKDHGTTSVYQTSREIGVVGEGFITYLTIYSEKSSLDPQTWWQVLSINETKRLYANYSPHFFRELRDVEITFTAGSEWRGERDIVLSKNGRNYLFILTDGNCNDCWQTSIEKDIYNSIKIN